jgi:SAM-dependent methyltransferase
MNSTWLSPFTSFYPFNPPASSPTANPNPTNEHGKPSPRRPVQAPFFVKALRGATPLVPTYTPHPYRPTPPTAAMAILRQQCQACCSWSSIKPELDPGGAVGTNGRPLPAVLPNSRIPHKRHQIENVVAFAMPMIDRGLAALAALAASPHSCRPRYTVVDFCCGSGWQTLPLAAYYPQVHFVLIDSKQRSLDVATERAARAGLTNVTTLLLSIEQFVGTAFDLGIALHACGPATDIAMQLCVRQNADFVMIPCCVGKVQVKASYLTTNDSVPLKDVAQEEVLPVLQYPRSRQGRGCLTREQYDAVAKAADFGHQDEEDEEDEGGGDGGDEDEGTDSTVQSSVVPLPIVLMDQTNKADRWKQERRTCKSIVEHDRALLCMESNYTCYLSVMEPKSCSPKNDVIVGRAHKYCHDQETSC